MLLLMYMIYYNVLILILCLIYTILHNYYIKMYYNISIVQLKLMWSEIDNENIKNII